MHMLFHIARRPVLATSRLTQLDLTIIPFKTSMSKNTYCYTCNAQHPIEEMRQVVTKKGTRWRCINTIKAAGQALAKRQTFGVQTTAKNKTEAKSRGLCIAAMRRDSTA